MDCLMSFREWEKSCKCQRTLGMEAIVDLRFKDFSNVCWLYFSYCVPKQLVEVICKNAQNPKTATPTVKPKKKKLWWVERTETLFRGLKAMTWQKLPQTEPHQSATCVSRTKTKYGKREYNSKELISVHLVYECGCVCVCRYVGCLKVKTSKWFLWHLWRNAPAEKYWKINSRRRQKKE